MSEFRMWAEDPVSLACSVVELPEIVAMEAKTSGNGHPREPVSPPETPVTILGVPFSHITLEQTIERIEQMIHSRRSHYVVTANVDFLVQARSDVELHRILVEADIVLCDGQPLVWASRWLGRPLPERVAGSDLVPLLIKLSAERGYRVFFLGGSPEVAEQAAQKTQSVYPALRICGRYSPPYNPLLEMDHEEIAERIRAAKPDLLFVSLGCPKAEKWMFMHYRSLGVPVAIGVGGTIDFLANRLKRAPLWMQRIGTEWLFRLLQEPRRLYSRYARDARQFGAAILQQLWHLQWRKPRNLHCAPSNIDLAEPTWRRIHPPQALTRSVIERDAQTWSRTLKHHCLVELSHVRFIDSTGIGLLIELQRHLSRQDLCLVLLDPGEAVRRAIRLLRLDFFFLVARDTVEARELIRGRLHQRRRITALSAHATLPLVWHGEITAANAEQRWTVAQTQIDSFEGYNEPITVDLSGVSFIDSTGVGLLLRTQKYAHSKGAEFRFLNPQEPVRNVLRLARLEALLLGRESSLKPGLLQEARAIFDQFRSQLPSFTARKAGL